jgi:hypothetical protein
MHMPLPPCPQDTTCYARDLTDMHPILHENFQHEELLFIKTQTPVEVVG